MTWTVSKFECRQLKLHMPQPSGSVLDGLPQEHFDGFSF